jgi:uncharacterized protein (DUF2164 family)
MSAIVSLSPEQKALLVDKIKTYFARELDQEIGGFDAEFLLDFFSNEIGIHYYNRGLYDGMDALKEKLELLADDVCYALEKSADSEGNRP